MIINIPIRGAKKSSPNCSAWFIGSIIVATPFLLKMARLILSSQIRKYYPKVFVVFDVGANRGEYTEIIRQNRPAKARDEFYLFEPQKACFSELQKKIW